MRILVLTLAAAIVAPVAPAQSGGAGTTHNVVTANYLYAPGESQVVPLASLVVFEGDSLVHTNLDADLHDVDATGLGPDGKPWFDSPLIGQGEQASVPVEDVPPGVYPFTCSIHPFMAGRLEVRAPVPMPEPQGPGDVEVSSGDNFFAPKTLTVPVGTTVLWRNEGQINHTVTAKDGSWDSSRACPTTNRCWAPGQTFSHTFNRAGTVPYYCKLHGTPQGTGHAGTIVVVAPGSKPTGVSALSASVSGGSVSVSGSATFGGEPPVTISEDAVGDGPAVPDLADETGVDLVSAAAYQPDAAIPALFFEWRLTGLPQTGGLPETVRYTIPFKIGAKQFQLQAKLSNLASVTLADDPAGHPGHIGNAFQLRGNCVTNYPAPPVPLANCPHLAWLGGSFDPATGTVRVKVPLGITPELVPGAALERNVSTNSSLVQISATYQAVASLGTTTGDVADWGTDDPTFTYRIPQPAVTLGIAPAGTPEAEVTFGSPTTLSGTSFAGTIAAGDPGTYDVWARACFGTVCGTRMTTATV